MPFSSQALQNTKVVLPLSCHWQGVPGKQERRGSCSRVHAHRARTGPSLFGA